MEYSKPFKELNKTNADIAGGKGASLGEMINSGIPVPDGYVVLADTFEEFIKETDLIQEIDAILDEVDHKAVHTVDEASEKIQALIKNAEMPQSIADEVLSSFETLGSEFVAVRSSATAEDGADHAWAGQLDSYLNITKEDVLEKVQHCWASLFTPRAIFYRFEKGLNTTKISVAVVVQKMVNSELSGIAFSVHPVTEDTNQIIIEAGLGLGEAIVSGSITPDAYVVEKEPRNILDVNVAEQSRGLFRKSDGGNEWIDLDEKGKEQVLTEDQITELSDLIIKIEKHYGFPCDIEWAFENDEFFIVQSRPITTLSNIEKVEKSLYEKYMETLEGNEAFTFSGPFSGLFTAFPWSNEKYYKRYYKTPPFHFLYIGEGRTSTETVDNTKYKLYAKEMFSNFINNKVTLKELEDNFNLLSEQAKEIYDKKIDNPKKIFMEAFELMNHLIAATVYTEVFDKEIAQEVIGEEINDEIWEKVTHPDFESFEKRWKKLLGEYKNIEDIQYIFTDYYFIKEIDDIKKELEIKEKELAESISEAETINIDELWAQFTKLVMKIRDFRKDPIARLHTVMAKCAKLLYPEATKDELVNLNGLEVVDDKLPNLDELRKRKNGYVMLIHPDFTFELSYDQLEETKRKINHVSDFDGEIKGTIARKGKIEGVVKVILDPENNKNFQEGEILVTSMTRPDFVLIMKKAGAIVTNEGGVTCHAAIISREIGIPCIIGTKIATKVLNDGDVVEVDADNGIIRIIK